MNNRLIFLALDAADVELIQQWANCNEMETFANIIAKNKMIRIRNEPGLYVGGVWPTISMGATSAHHGRYCWKQLRAGTYEDEFYQVDQIKGEPIWDKLDKHGKSVCVIDIPKSIPGTKYKGRFVKDWGTHDPSSGGFRIYGWMKSTEFLTRYGRDEVGRCDAIERTKNGFQQFRTSLINRASARTKMVCDVLSDGFSEVVMTSFSEAHCAGHQCWHIHDPTHEMHDEGLRKDLGDPVKDVYLALDKSVGQILKHIEPNDTVMLLATHGMGTNYNAVELLNAIVADFEYDSLSLIEQNALRVSGVPHLLSYDNLDFRRVLRIFPVPNNGAYAAFRMNIKGREPHGRLTPDRSESFLQDFQNRLFALKNADTGEPIFRSSIVCKSAFCGSCSEKLPDLLVEWNRSCPIKRILTPQGVLNNSYGGNPRTGDHRADGGMWVIGQQVDLFKSVEEMQSSELSQWMMRVCELADCC